MVYSNDEDEEGPPAPCGSEKVSRKFRLESSEDNVNKLEKRKTKFHQESSGEKKGLITVIANAQIENDVLAGKDLESISPLIKRLLIDTYKNHTKQEKLKRGRSPRKRTVTLSIDSKNHSVKASNSNRSKWRNVLDGQKYTSLQNEKSSHEISKLSRKSSENLIAFDRGSTKTIREKPLQITRQRSKSLENLHCGSLKNYSRLSPVKNKVFIIVKFHLL